MTAPSDAPAVGIDLGTTYSCVSVFRHGGVEIINNDQGNKITPSYVAFSGTERLIGDSANSRIAFNPTNTVFNVNRLLGRKWIDPVVQKDKTLRPFELVDVFGLPNVQVEFYGRKKLFCAEEICSMLLTKMKEIAESHLGGQAVTDVVVTIPAYYSSQQRQAIKDAGIIAGLNVVYLLNASTAAAIACHRWNDADRVEKNVVIFDLGGGTLDVTVLTIDGGIFEVKSTSGDNYLGGEDFTNRMVHHLIREFRRKHRKDITNSKKSLCRLRTACERAKCTLSSQTQANIEIDALFEGIDFYTTITRTQFEELNEDLFRSTLEPVEKALHDAKFDKAQINDIVLVGGSTRIPKIQRLLQNFFDGKELNKSINPDEGVVYGAAIQAAILRRMVTKDLLLLNVIPLSLGIEVPSGAMTTIIKRNATFPTYRTHTFSTEHDNQTNMAIKIFEGERAMAKDNNFLGELVLTGIPAAPKGVPQIEIKLDLDASFSLKVVITEKSSGKNVAVKNIVKSYLPVKEIKRMAIEAQRLAFEDKRRKECISAKNACESYAISIENAIEDGNIKVSKEERREIASECKQLVNWLDHPDHQLVKREEYVSRGKALEKTCARIAMKTLFNVDIQYLS